MSEQDRLRLARALDLQTMMQQRYSLEIRCTHRQCEHRRIVDPHPLFALCRIKLWQSNVDQLMNKLKCGRCGAKWPVLKATVMPPDAGAAIGPTSDEEFKRMVRRHRG